MDARHRQARPRKPRLPSIFAGKATQHLDTALAASLHRLVASLHRDGARLRSSRPQHSPRPLNHQPAQFEAVGVLETIFSR